MIWQVNCSTNGIHHAITPASMAGFLRNYYKTCGWVTGCVLYSLYFNLTCYHQQLRSYLLILTWWFAMRWSGTFGQNRTRRQSSILLKYRGSRSLWRWCERPMKRVPWNHDQFIHSIYILYTVSSTGFYIDFIYLPTSKDWRFLYKIT